MQPKATVPRKSRRLTRLGAPALGLILLGIGVALSWPGTSGVVVGVLIANTGFLLWAGRVTVSLLNGRQPAASAADTRPKPKARPPMRFPIIRPRPKPPAFHSGDYVASGRDLFRIEYVRGRRVLLEDCRSGTLLDIDSDDCAALKIVKRAPRPEPVPSGRLATP